MLASCIAMLASKRKGWTNVAWSSIVEKGSFLISIFSLTLLPLKRQSTPFRDIDPAIRPVMQQFISMNQGSIKSPAGAAHLVVGLKEVSRCWSFLVVIYRGREIVEGMEKGQDRIWMGKRLYCLVFSGWDGLEGWNRDGLKQKTLFFQTETVKHRDPKPRRLVCRLSI